MSVEKDIRKIMKQKVVVIGHGYTSRLGVIRALGRCGFYIVDVAISSDLQRLRKQKPKPIDAYSCFVDEFYYAPANKDDLIKFLLNRFANEVQKPVLFPESDFVASAIDAAYDRLTPFFYLPNIDDKQGQMLYWMDKNLQKARAKTFGLNVAGSHIIEIRNGQFSIPGDIKFPCFAKPISTLHGGKKGVGKCETTQELVERLKLISSFQPSMDVMVEDYLQIDKEYALVGFSDGNNVIIPGIIHITHLGQGNHFGVAVAGKVLPPEPFETLIEQFKKLISSIRFVGIFDIDFFGCDNQYYFGEINMRFGGSGTAIIASSDNLPQKYVDFLSKGVYDSYVANVANEATFVNERMCHDEWYAGVISNEKYHTLTEGADISFVKDENDAKPYHKYLAQHRVAVIKKLLKNLRLFK